jgi:hypothetical protein
MTLSWNRRTTTAAGAALVAVVLAPVGIAAATDDTHGAIEGAVHTPSGATWRDKTVVLTRTDTGARFFGEVRHQKLDLYDDNLKPGTYVLQFGRASGPAITAADYYKGKPETAGKAGATKITVTAGKTTTLKPVTLTASKDLLLGHVTTKSGKGRTNLEVVAVPTSPRFQTRSTVTGKGGRFVVRGLSAVRYRLYVWNAPSGFAGCKGYVEKKLGTFRAKNGKTLKVGTFTFNAKAAPDGC